MTSEQMVNWLSFGLLVAFAYVALYHAAEHRSVKEGRIKDPTGISGAVKKEYDKAKDEVQDTYKSVSGEVVDAANAAYNAAGQVYDQTTEFLDDAGNLFTADLFSGPLTKVKGDLLRFIGGVNGAINSVNSLSGAATNFSNSTIRKLDPNAPLSSSSSTDVATYDPCAGHKIKSWYDRCVYLNKQALAEAEAQAQVSVQKASVKKAYGQVAM